MKKVVQAFFPGMFEGAKESQEKSTDENRINRSYLKAIVMAVILVAAAGQGPTGCAKHRQPREAMA